MRPPYLWDKGPPPHINFTAKVYGGIHTLPPFGFELVTSIEETNVINNDIKTSPKMKDPKKTSNLQVDKFFPWAFYDGAY